jgi:cobalamin biosynthesis protein CobT
MRFSKDTADAQYKQVLTDVPQGLGTTRSNLQRLLHSIDYVGWSRNEESGRLNRRALTKFATGSANIFSRREYVEAETSAVSVLIDCSGSMNDGTAQISRISVAQKIAIHLSKILQQSRVPFAVTGFHSGYESNQIIGNAHVQVPVFIPIKTWKQSMQQAIPALGIIDQLATSGTPDYSAIYNALDDLGKRNEKRKILFLLTDANGYREEHMQHLQSLADKIGITIVAIGIQSNEVLDCFVNSAAVSDLSGLAGESFNQLLKAVKRKA